jgi:hypothetical protein
MVDGGWRRVEDRNIDLRIVKKGALEDTLQGCIDTQW